MPYGIAAAGIAAGGSILGGVIGGGAADKAASEQAAAINAATQAEVNMYNQTVAREAPWVTAGGNALNTVQGALGIGPGGTGSINPAVFTSSPGYQFALNQGQGAINNQATLSGGPLSGNALRALTTFGTGQANNTFQTWLNNVSGVSNTGASAAANLGAAGTAVGGQIGANDIAGGNAAAAGTVGGANSLIGGINGVSQAAMLYALTQGGLTPGAANNYVSGAYNSGVGSGGMFSDILGGAFQQS